MTARVHRATTWPLLRKDLTEMAAQPRAYWLRMLCVAVLYTLFLFLLPPEYAYSYGGGAGGRMFQNLNFQLAICLTVCAPAAVASAISGEKERNAFALLLVTDLRPRELLLQKYLGRLVPVFGLMLCALPLYAVCYSHGGVEPLALAGSACLQTLVLLQAGAVALLMSCFFRSTTVAMAMSWVFFAGQMLGGIVLDEIGFSDDEAWAFFGIYHAAEGRFRSGFAGEFWRMACLGGSTVALLLLARFFLLRRALLRPGNPLLRASRWVHTRLDRVRGKGRASILPGVEAAPWRERHRLGLSTGRFQVRIVVVTLVLALPAALMFFAGGRRIASDMIVLFFLATWFLTGTCWLSAGVAAARADVQRRNADVLRLTTEGLSESVRARGSALLRLAWLLVPALLLPALANLMRAQTISIAWNPYRVAESGFRMLAHIGAMIVYPALYLWLGMWLGSVLRTTGRALVAGWVGCVLWTLLGLFFIEEARGSSISSTDWDNLWLYLLSPASIMTRLAHNGDLRDAPLQAFLFLNFALYAGLAGLLRRQVMLRVERD